MSWRNFLKVAKENLKNGVIGLCVDIHTIESTFSEVYESEDVDRDILEPSDGNKIVVNNIVIASSGNIGEVKLDFPSSEKIIARLYSSQFNRVVIHEMTVDGDIDEPVHLIADTANESLFVNIGYMEKSD